jgi:hypothetical protein
MRGNIMQNIIDRADFTRITGTIVKGAGKNAVTNLLNAWLLATITDNSGDKPVIRVRDVDAEGAETVTVLSMNKAYGDLGLTRSVMQRWTFAVAPVMLSGVEVTALQGNVSQGLISQVLTLSEYVNGQKAENKVTPEMWAELSTREHAGIPALIEAIREAIAEDMPNREAEKAEKAEERAEKKAAEERAATPEGIIEAIEALVRGLDARRDFLTEDNCYALQVLGGRMLDYTPGTMVEGDAEAEAA